MKDIIERSLRHQIDELPKDKINLTLYFTYFEGNLMLKWLEYEEYNKKAKLYKLISKEIIDTYVKKMLDKILNKYNNIVLKRLHNIRNCKLVKYDIRLDDKKLIKHKQFSRLVKENE